MGGAQPRRPAPLRDAHARRCPGRAVLEHDPEQARGYSRAFAGFDPAAVARFTEKDVERLLEDTGIVRNRLKVESTVANAARVLEVQQELGSFDAYLWAFVEGEPVVGSWRSLAELPAETDLSRALQDLKRRGFRFVGATLCYAFMQTVGMVNDHTVDCFRFREIAG